MAARSERRAGSVSADRADLLRPSSILIAARAQARSKITAECAAKHPAERAVSGRQVPADRFDAR
jgi:hypothetical protein